MKTALDLFFKSLKGNRNNTLISIKDIIYWWEQRRLAFNLIVGFAGLVTCFVIFLIGIMSYVFFKSDFGLPDPPLFALFLIPIYGLLANLMYTSGWITELVVKLLAPKYSNKYGMRVYSIGMIFSLILTLAPALLVAGLVFFKLVRRIV